MRFQKTVGSSLPSINLVPMLDVLMTVLTFFILISMSLAQEQGLDLTLPDPDLAPLPNAPEPLILDLDEQGVLSYRDQPIALSQAQGLVRQYLAQTEEGAIILDPDRQLSLQVIIETLGSLRSIGGDQVSLAVEPLSSGEP
ncbi:MAG: ExbD/TolR family protein [Prochlorothrix sp.]